MSGHSRFSSLVATWSRGERVKGLTVSGSDFIVLIEFSFFTRHDQVFLNWEFARRRVLGVTSAVHSKHYPETPSPRVLVGTRHKWDGTKTIVEQTKTTR